MALQVEHASILVAITHRLATLASAGKRERGIKNVAMAKRFVVGAMLVPTVDRKSHSQRAAGVTTWRHSMRDTHHDSASAQRQRFVDVHQSR